VSLDALFDIEITGWAGGAIAFGIGIAATVGLLATFWRPQSKVSA
jgi:putative oxidoreductase